MASRLGARVVAHPQPVRIGRERRARAELFPQLDPPTRAQLEERGAMRGRPMVRVLTELEIPGHDAPILRQHHSSSPRKRLSSGWSKTVDHPSALLERHPEHVAELLDLGPLGYGQVGVPRDLGVVAAVPCFDAAPLSATVDGEHLIHRGVPFVLTTVDVPQDHGPHERVLLAVDPPEHAHLFQALGGQVLQFVNDLLGGREEPLVRHAFLLGQEERALLVVLGMDLEPLVRLRLPDAHGRHWPAGFRSIERLPQTEAIQVVEHVRWRSWQLAVRHRSVRLGVRLGRDRRRDLRLLVLVSGELLGHISGTPRLRRLLSAAGFNRLVT